jgi:hypothetical protein
MVRLLPQRHHKKKAKFGIFPKRKKQGKILGIIEKPSHRRGIFKRKRVQRVALALPLIRLLRPVTKIVKL